MSEHIQRSVAQGVLRIEIARPDKKNALTGGMYEAMIAAMDAAARDDEMGAILFEGSGGSFTAGNDLNDFLTFAEDFQKSPALQFVRALAGFPKPVVAAVDGVAVGVGATMLLHCDLAYATPAARFRMPFVDLGVVPEAASSLLLPQRIGLARASELLLLCEGFDAARALDMGLLNGVVAPEDLGRIAMERAVALAQKPRNAVLATRRLLRGNSAEIAVRIEEEAALFAAALQAPEASAIIRAFLAKGRS